MADSRIAFCCTGNVAMQQHFQLWQWREFILLMHITGMHDKRLAGITRYIRHNVPSTIPSLQAAQQLKHRLGLLQGECCLHCRKVKLLAAEESPALHALHAACLLSHNHELLQTCYAPALQNVLHYLCHQHWLLCRCTGAAQGFIDWDLEALAALKEVGLHPGECMLSCLLQSKHAMYPCSRMPTKLGWCCRWSMAG